ncbi:unnamed protein product [Trifolium pratense]|uniref:Uncharacterized protein n=1 Tax=Trifolium pratense TaxID=57577 RepID=A0ACB0K569_TRIPR|nr:unnamed protein product [Trifolium pratense]
MPKNTTQIQLIRNMDEKIASLEAELSGVKTTLHNMEQNQARLIALFEKSIGKSIAVEDEIAVDPAKKSIEGSMRRQSHSGSNHLDDDSLAEFRRSVKKVELPMFNGEDPAGWISRAEVYFRVQNTRPEIKVNLAQLCMEGGTIHFFNSLINENEKLDWETLKQELLERYGGQGEGDVYEQLTELRQKGSVDDYINDFEYLTAQIPRLPDKQFLGYFLHGLKEEIRGKVRSLSVVGELTRSKVLQVARAVERETKKDGPGFNRPHKPVHGSNRTGISGSQKDRSDWVFVKNGSGDGSKEGGGGPKQDRPNSNDPRRSQNRDRGYSSLSYNEIMERRKKGLCFRCGGANHLKHQCPERHLKLEIAMDELQIRVDAQIFDLGCVDVVLGIEWLRTLGDMIVNWQKQTMSFWYNKQWITMKGVDSQLSNMETLHSVVCKPWRNEVVDWKMNKVNRGVFHSLDEEQSRELEQLLSMCAGVFQEPKGLPPKRLKEHEIALKDGHEAVNVRPYRYPHHHKNEIEKQVKEMLATGIIRPSTSSFSSPVILVKKKDGSWRMCVDYRALNKATVPDKFPIPVIEELLDELHGAKYFSKLDLKSGYHQVRVKEEDVHKTAFRTHEGHYEFMVMPFGLMNAPSTFQSLMNEVFKPLLRKTVLVFFDDILVYSESWQEHVMHLEQVLLILQKHGLVANKKKCQFGQQSIEYLGHLINGTGVAVDPNKVVSVTNWPIPKNVKGVRGFLGLTGYYRKFIRNYGKIAKPLTELTKKDAFVWSDEAYKAFESLKKSLTTAPVLALPDFSKEFIIECDASGGGIGAILMRSKRPIAYFSKALGVRNLAKSAYEKELMAVVLAIQHWRPYLIGRKFTVSTDQKSLKQLLQQRMVTADQQNWAAKLLGYDFEIVYKPGKLNRGADALSRIDEGGELCQGISCIQWKDELIVKVENQKDEQLQQIIRDLQADIHSRPGYEYKQGVLLYEGRLVLSAKSVLIPVMLSEFHSTPQGGHSGFYRTYRRLAANLYWVGMKNTVQEYVKACDICQRQKYLTSSPGGLLQPLPIPERIWEDISMDFITNLPRSKGYEAILVIVDRLSKYAHFTPLKHPYTARSIAEVFVREVVRLHGIPLSIVSDRDPIFMSNFWQELFKLQGTKLKMSTSYHPESDGQTEVVNRCLETYLRCFISDQPKTWSNWLSWSEYWFNTSYSAATGKTPYEIVYGRSPPVITRWVQGETRVAAVQRELVDRDEALRQLREQLVRAQDRMKHFADKKRSDRSFEVGEWVFVKLRAHRQQSVVCRINAKLAARYFGPYPVVARVGAVAYKLELPEGSKVHPVFHVSLLKKAVGNYHGEDKLPDLEGESGIVIEPEVVLARRIVQVQNEAIEQVLVQWKGQNIEEATWEDSVMMKSQFPQLSLEDKAVQTGGSIDRTQSVSNNNNDSSLVQSSVGPRVWKVYSRRGKMPKVS